MLGADVSMLCGHGGLERLLLEIIKAVGQLKLADI